MKTKTFRSRATRRAESGQVMLFVLLGLGLFLIGAMAFAIDMSNLWFNRQAAQSAADAACTAGAMDMLVDYTNGVTNQGGFSVGGSPSAVDCSTSQTPAPCQYATLNGFDSAISQSSANSGALGNNVTFQVSNIGPPGVTGIPPSTVAANAFLSVKITDNIPTFFAGMLRGTNKQNVGATAICGVIQATSPIPILVLRPQDAGTLSMNGGGSNSQTGCKNPLCGDIVIIGGPSKSIQVNSKTANPISFSGGPTVNLCGGGGNYCGSALGAWGTEANPGNSNFWGNTSTCSISTVNNLCKSPSTQAAPQWNSPSAPIADPYAGTAAPAALTFTGATRAGPYQTVPGGTNGCPLVSTSSCDEYGPGNYAAGITIQNATAIFDPGIYYIGGNAATSGQCGPGKSGSFCELANSCIRPSTLAGDGSYGVTIYFADSNSVYVVGNGGNCTGAAAFSTKTGTGSLANGVLCPGATTFPKDLPNTLTGSVLLAPCQAPDPKLNLCLPNCGINNGFGFGDPLGANDPSGEQRGLLFFQDRAVNASNNPNWGGGGSMLLAGTMYFHQCKLSGTDTGQGCDYTTPAFNDLFNLGGSSGSNTYVLGDIIVDQLSVGGSGQIVMDLNPSAAFTTLKATLLQ